MTDRVTRALTVEEALERVLAPARVITDAEMTGLTAAVGRMLAEPLVARLTQPPFNASAMDGYAVRAADVATLPAALTVIGESAAGHGFAGSVAQGQAVRIFTGAPIPAGADAIVIQENTKRNGAALIVTEGQPDPEHIRPAGGDFKAGMALLGEGRRLSARDVTLAAAMGHGQLPVRRKPVVAILATGDELVQPGTEPGPDQIVCSNVYGIAAMIEAAGGSVRPLGIAKDTRQSLEDHIAAAAGADVLVTVGGASVGDHDLVAPVLTSKGMTLDFWKIAMRPGKPLMNGRLGDMHVLGLPGNPVSSLICTRLFVMPLVRALLGQPRETDRPRLLPTTVKLSANGPRAHYMRATMARLADGTEAVTPVASQDSSLMKPLAAADCLIVRPIGAPAVPAGADVPCLALDF